MTFKNTTDMFNKDMIIPKFKPRLLALQAVSLPVWPSQHCKSAAVIFNM